MHWTVSAGDIVVLVIGEAIIAVCVFVLNLWVSDLNTRVKKIEEGKNNGATKPAST